MEQIDITINYEEPLCCSVQTEVVRFVLSESNEAQFLHGTDHRNNPHHSPRPRVSAGQRSLECMQTRENM